MITLIENVQSIGDNTNTDGGKALALIEYARGNANAGNWPVFGVTKQDQHLIPFRFSPNTEFKWEGDNGQLTLIGGDAGLSFSELVGKLESAYNEFNAKREQANAEAGLEKEMFTQNMHMKCKLTSTQSVGNAKLTDLKPIVCDGMQAIFLVPAKIKDAFSLIQKVESFLNMMDGTTGGKLSYPLMSAIVNFIDTIRRTTTTDGTTIVIAGNVPRAAFFLGSSVNEATVKDNFKCLAFAINTLQLDKRRKLSRSLNRVYFNGGFSGKVLTFDFTGPNQSSAVNAEVVNFADRPLNPTNAMFVAGKKTLQEFQQWWAQAPIDLKNSFCSNINTIYYAKFQGDTTSDAVNADSTVRRTEFVAYVDHSEHGMPGDLYVYGKTPPPRKRSPTFETIMLIKAGDKSNAFYPFLNRTNGTWHGHLYKLLTEAVNSSPFGLRVVYDPQGYLNWLYVNVPAMKRAQLKDVGPGVPQTIGLNVTTDLTEGIPRRQQAPLSPEQIAAMEAALNKRDEDAEAVENAQANAEQNLLNAQQVKSELESVLPPVLKTAQFTGLIDFWPGASSAGYDPPRPLPNANTPYVIINFPGVSKNEYVGNDAKQMLDDLGLWEYIQPIANRIIQKFGEDVSKHPELLLVFDNKIKLDQMGS